MGNDVADRAIIEGVNYYPTDIEDGIDFYDKYERESTLVSCKGCNCAIERTTISGYCNGCASEKSNPQIALKKIIFNITYYKLEYNLLCPECDSGALILKDGKNGSFYGCSTFPSCKKSMSVGLAEKIFESRCMKMHEGGDGETLHGWRKYGLYKSGIVTPDENIDYGDIQDGYKNEAWYEDTDYNDSHYPENIEEVESMYSRINK